MDLSIYYAVALTAVIVFFTCRRITVFIAAFCRYGIRSHIIYPLVWIRGKYTQSISRFHFLLLLLYLLANGIVLGFAGSDLQLLSRRAAFTSLLNLIPLFFGGKTNPLISFVGLPLSDYYIAHHWFGRVAVIEAMVHAGLSVSHDSTIIFTSVSGFIVSFALVIIFIWSLYVIRRLHYHIFAITHVFLALIALGAVLWHVIILTSLVPKIGAGCAATFWVATTCFRVLRMAYYGRIPVFTKKQGQILRCRLQLKRHITLFPGSYFYLYFPNASTGTRFHGHAMIAAWWEDPTASGHASEIIFLMHQEGSIRSMVRNNEHSSDARGNERFADVCLDGPYGHDLRLSEFENVLLAAKGVGIIGILPYAMHLARRRYFDQRQLVQAGLSQENIPAKALFRDKTRRVDLFWLLEDNSQQKWVKDELQGLQKLDPEMRLLLIWCIYPSPPRSKPPFEVNDYWKCFYPATGSDFHQNGIFKEIAKGANSPGQTILVTCGEADFTTRIRNEAIFNSAMQFAEVEYRPWASVSNAPPRVISMKRIQKSRTQTEDIEGQLLARDEE